MHRRLTEDQLLLTWLFILVLDLFDWGMAFLDSKTWLPKRSQIPIAVATEFCINEEGFNSTDKHVLFKAISALRQGFQQLFLSFRAKYLISHAFMASGF
ncbi:MAG TPA: hypothetical protein VHA33_23450 [Candidatus Angelobacter sp.]|jgi:hypothetical protein|nr:hypothetical protein [Candidatus Angelobacter sp.]